MDDLKNMREFIEISITHLMLEHPDHLCIHECPKCRTRYPFKIERTNAVDAVVDWVFNLAKDNYITREILLARMRESAEKDEDFQP